MWSGGWNRAAAVVSSTLCPVTPRAPPTRTTRPLPLGPVCLLLRRSPVDDNRAQSMPTYTMAHPRQTRQGEVVIFPCYVNSCKISSILPLVLEA